MCTVRVPSWTHCRHNHGMAAVGRELWAHPEQGAQAHVQADTEDLQGGDPTHNLCQCLVTCTVKCSWPSEGTSCAAVCAHTQEDNITGLLHWKQNCLEMPLKADSV